MYFKAPGTTNLEFKRLCFSNKLEPTNFKKMLLTKVVADLTFYESYPCRLIPGSGKKQKLAVMFEDWLTASEDWDTSKLVVQMKEVHSKGRRGSRQWLCRYQIVAKYGGDENIADEIISAKLSLDEKERALVVRDHPDTPLPELRQFLVFDAESEYDSSDSILESLFSATSTEKGGKDKGKKKKRKGSSSSSSDSSCSSDSSSSDSSEKKKKKKKGKKSKKSKKGKKAKGKKGKSKADKEKAKQKQQEKDKKDKDREEEKKKQTVRGEAKKACDYIMFFHDCII